MLFNFKMQISTFFGPGHLNLSWNFLTQQPFRTISKRRLKIQHFGAWFCYHPFEMRSREQKHFSKRTPTYPRPRTNSLWRNSFHLRVWGGLGYAPGVCWGSLRTLDREQTVCVCSGGICLKVPDWLSEEKFFVVFLLGMMETRLFVESEFLFGETLNQWKYSDDLKCTCLRILRRTHMPICHYLSMAVPFLTSSCTTSPMCDGTGNRNVGLATRSTRIFRHLHIHESRCFVVPRFVSCAHNFSWLMFFLDYTALCNKDS